MPTSIISLFWVDRCLGDIQVGFDTECDEKKITFWASSREMNEKHQLLTTQSSVSEYSFRMTNFPIFCVSRPFYSQCLHGVVALLEPLTTPTWDDKSHMSFKKDWFLDLEVGNNMDTCGFCKRNWILLNNILSNDVCRSAESATRAVCYSYFKKKATLVIIYWHLTHIRKYWRSFFRINKIKEFLFISRSVSSAQVNCIEQ